MELTYFSTNNRCTYGDMDVLHTMGIRILKASRHPMSVWVDPNNGRMRAEVGLVVERRDGLISIRPYVGIPPSALNVLVSTAVECLERQLHRRDDWTYYRATKTRVGRWSAQISVGIPDGASFFEAHVEAMRPAAVRQSHEDLEDFQESAINIPDEATA